MWEGTLSRNTKYLVKGPQELTYWTDPKWCTFSACHTSCELKSWILIFLCSFFTQLSVHRSGRWHTVLTGLQSLALAGGFAGLTPHRHTVLQKLQFPVLLPTLGSNLYHLWSLQHHTHIFIVQHTYDTHTHNIKINSPSVISVCPTHLLHAVNLKCQVSKSYTWCNSLIMCRPKVVLIFRLYVPATNTSQHWVIHCFDISSKIWTKINTLLKHYFQNKYIQCNA